MSLLTELKRRKVVRVALVYAVVAWGVAQVAELAVSTFGAPEWVMQVLVALLLLGLPIAVVLAWAFEVTPDGVRRAASAPTGLDSASVTATGAADAVAAGANPRGGSAWLSPRSLVVILLFALVGLGGWFVGHSSAREGGFAVASIAVLPFSNLSGDDSNRAFTDGLHDDLLTQLSRIAALRVTSRTSVQEYRGSAKSIPTIARELGVAAVLEGGVQRSGERLRINVQLIDGATDDHLWAETYDSDLTVSDIFDIQTRIATSITAALRARLTEEERGAIAEQPTASLEAYEAYLAGLAATDSAALLFERAAELDPGFAEAWAAAAHAWAWQFRLLIDDITAAALRSEYRARAGSALERARERAPDRRETRLAAGYVQYYVDWDFDAAGRTFGGLIAEYPQDAEMHYAGGLIDRRQGRWDRAEERLRTAARLDPRSSAIARDLAWTLREQSRLDEAERVARLGLARDPEDALLNETMADILAARGAPLVQIEPYWNRARNYIDLAVRRRLAVGGPGLAEYYRELSAVPPARWLNPGDRQWALALLAEAAGLPVASAHADSAIVQMNALDLIEVSDEAPLGERRPPAFGHAKRGLSLAIGERREQAKADLRRSRTLWRVGDDHADDLYLAALRAWAWAVLGSPDDFFAELAPHAHSTSLLYARQLTDDPILSRFADDPRYGALIQTLQSP
jgi:TolB-like protein